MCVSSTKTRFRVLSNVTENKPFMAELAKQVVLAADCRSKAEKVGVLFYRVPALQDQTMLEGKDWVRCESMQASRHDIGDRPME